MQLSRLYSNHDALFEPIDFNCGSAAKIINVVFARVTRKKERDGDSHNLGKTTLIHLLDFALLMDITSTNHFLEKHSQRFKSFVFYLELMTADGTFLTVRRSVEYATKISLKRHNEGNVDLAGLTETGWDHWEVGLAAARALVDSYLNLTLLAPWDYRKGVSYFLRTQEDYQDIFQIQKFMQGKDREWKPYIAAILGLDHRAVHEKYVVDDEIEAKQKARDERKSEIQLVDADRGELASQIDIKSGEIEDTQARLDAFDFTEEERRVSKKLVDSVEARIAEINSTNYDLESDISELRRSLRSGIKFDLDKVRQIFDESKIAISGELARSYEELVVFNQRLTRERNAALRKRIADLEAEREKLDEEQAVLNSDRQRLLQIIRDADTFRKYKALQNEVADHRVQLAYLETQLKKIDAVAEIERDIRQLRKLRDDHATAIELSLQRGSGIKTNVTQLFNRYVKRVLGINGEFVISQNKSGNIEFEVKTKDAVGNDTSQSDGHTYRRLLCALFDLATLKALEEARFYHFVYHDGIFEGLDNRVKLRLLELIRECISDGKVQYILSVIESDLPRSLNDDEPVAFSETEIILTLHDQGDNGRLFKMPPF